MDRNEFYYDHKFQVKPSPVSGLGLFANKNIQEGETLFFGYGMVGDNGEHIRMGKLMYPQVGKIIFDYKYCQLKPNDMLNHSESQANCFSQWLGEDRMFIIKVASRFIAPGEEILCDYRQTVNLIKSAGMHLVNNFLDFASHVNTR